MGSPFDTTGYSAVLVRFWRVPVHREALEVLAEAASHSSEADYLAFEWSLIAGGNRAEFKLRREWALEDPMHPGDLIGWRYTNMWGTIAVHYGPHADRHHACLCRWLHDRPYPQNVSGGGGSGDAGGRARRIIADLDWARGRVPEGLSEYDIEKAMSAALGWLPPPDDQEKADDEVKAA